MEFNKKISINNKDQFNPEGSDNTDNKDQENKKETEGDNNEYNKDNNREINNNRENSKNYKKTSNYNNNQGMNRNYGQRDKSSNYSGSMSNNYNNSYNQSRKKHSSIIPTSKKEALLKLLSAILEYHEIEYLPEHLIEETSVNGEESLTLTKKALILFEQISDKEQYSTENIASIFSGKTKKFYFIITTDPSHDQYGGGRYGGGYGQQNRRYNDNDKFRN